MLKQWPDVSGGGREVTSFSFHFLGLFEICFVKLKGKNKLTKFSMMHDHYDNDDYYSNKQCTKTLFSALFGGS